MASSKRRGAETQRSEAVARAVANKRNESRESSEHRERQKQPDHRPGRVGGVRDLNRKERVKSLSDAALQLFLSRGLDVVTIDDITQMTGVAKGTFYRYFDDKEALVEALVAPVRSEMIAGLTACGKALAVVGAVERLLYAVLSEEDVGNPLEIPDLLTTIVLDGLRKP